MRLKIPTGSGMTTTKNCSENLINWPAKTDARAIQADLEIWGSLFLNFDVFTYNR